MKSDLMHSRVQLEKDILDRLVTEVKETVATDVQLPKVERTAPFSVLKLWNMRRNARYATIIGNRPPRIVNGIGY
ncbi:MAG TPA: hypothetical protein VKU83_01740 [Puia sp.]|nr:hypothetical protein [Puia sp.]